FALDAPHRFIIRRVSEMGWTRQRFEAFDRHSGSGDRYRNSIERIGKKYQWIALYEFLARASDRFPLFESLGFDRSMPSPFAHPRKLIQEGHTNPSIFRVPPREERDKSGGGWWSPPLKEPLWNGQADNDWLLCDAGIPDLRTCFLPVAPGDARRWAVLQGY